MKTAIGIFDSPDDGTFVISREVDDITSTDREEVEKLLCRDAEMPATFIYSIIIVDGSIIDLWE